MSEEEMEIAKAFLKDIKLMIASEVDAKLNGFLEREQSELQDLFAKVKKEDAERIEIILEGVKSHTSRIKNLEQKVKMTNYRIEEVV